MPVSAVIPVHGYCDAGLCSNTCGYCDVGLCSNTRGYCDVGLCDVFCTCMHVSNPCTCPIHARVQCMHLCSAVTVTTRLCLLHMNSKNVVVKWTPASFIVSVSVVRLL